MTILDAKNKARDIYFLELEIADKKKELESISESFTGKYRALTRITDYGTEFLKYYSGEFCDLDENDIDGANELVDAYFEELRG